MKVTRVEAIHLRLPEVNERCDGSQETLVVKVHTDAGFVGKSESVLYQSDLLPAGKYVFTLLADAAFPGGDADLRVRAGVAPDLTQTYKCKSYIGNSNERCVLSLAAPAKVFMSVTGDALGVQSHFELRAFAQ